MDAIVIGVGSGGTVTGVGETIKAWTNDMGIAAVEPYESQALGGGLTEFHGISDLGYGFVPENFNAYVVDNVVAVNTTDAQRAAQKVLRTDAIPASVASGAVLQAAAQLIHVGASRLRPLPSCPDGRSCKYVIRRNHSVPMTNDMTKGAITLLLIRFTIPLARQPVPAHLQTSG